MCVIYDMIMP